MRQFFDNDLEFIQNMIEVSKTIHHYARDQQSDLSIYLHIFEELGHLSHLHRSKLVAMTRRKGIQLASQQVLTFIKYAAQIAALVLQHIAVEPEDEEMLDAIASKKGAQFGTNSGRRRMCLNLALATSADIVMQVPRMETKSFFEKAHATRDQVPRAVLFDGVSEEILAVGEDHVRSAFSKVLGERNLKAILDPSKRTLTIVVETEATAKAEAASKSKIASTPVAILKRPKPGESSVAAAVAQLKPMSPEPETKDDDAVALSGLFASKDPSEPHPCLQALLLIPRCHSSRHTVVPLSDDPSKESAVFPSATVAAKYGPFLGLREGGEVCRRIQADRWSVLSGPARVPKGPVDINQLAFGFGIQGLGDGSMLAINACFAVPRELPGGVHNVDFLAMMLSAPMQEQCHTSRHLALRTYEDYIVGVDAMIGFCAPLHMLVEVNILLALQHLAQSPRCYSRAKEDLLSLLVNLMCKESEDLNAPNDDILLLACTDQKKENKKDKKKKAKPGSLFSRQLVSITPLLLGTSLCPLLDMEALFVHYEDDETDGHDDDTNSDLDGEQRQPAVDPEEFFRKDYRLLCGRLPPAKADAFGRFVEICQSVCMEADQEQRRLAKLRGPRRVAAGVPTKAPAIVAREDNGRTKVAATTPPPTQSSSVATLSLEGRQLQTVIQRAYIDMSAKKIRQDGSCK